jgi:hypothetical protein
MSFTSSGAICLTRSTMGGMRTLQAPHQPVVSMIHTALCLPQALCSENSRASFVQLVSVKSPTLPCIR